MNDPLDDSIAPSQANNLDIEDGDLEQDNRAIGRFENPGVPVLFGRHNMPTPLLAMAPPEMTALMSQVDDNDYLRMVQPSAKSKVEKPSKKIQMARKKSEAQQRQDYMFTLFYREQDLQQQRIGAIQNSIRGGPWGRLVEPIQTRGADYAPHTTTSPSGFKKLSTSLESWSKS